MYKFIYLLILFLFSCGFVDGDSILTVKNNSNFTITNVKLEYSSSKKIVNIGNIKPFSIYKYQIDSPLQEDSIKIFYNDSSGIMHEGIAAGYIIKGSGDDYQFEVK